MSTQKNELHRKILYAIRGWSKDSSDGGIGERTLLTLIRLSGANESDVKSAVQDLLKTGEIYVATTERFFKVA